ncbi:hypothetical protein [Faecalibaculum rodentium]|uniref:hypothetical protein n=1 Tax=Faecalibaculum rodentium TaxID=1702221 RepID=UPI0023F336C0|nr:hypothetical protein [Faecalibaculum rodentium]
MMKLKYICNGWIVHLFCHFPEIITIFFQKLICSILNLLTCREGNLVLLESSQDISRSIVFHDSQCSFLISQFCSFPEILIYLSNGNHGMGINIIDPPPVLDTAVFIAIRNENGSFSCSLPVKHSLLDVISHVKKRPGARCRIPQPLPPRLAVHLPGQKPYAWRGVAYTLFCTADAVNPSRSRNQKTKKQAAFSCPSASSASRTGMQPVFISPGSCRKSS